MEKLTSYEILGLPDALAIAITLITLSVALAPWFGGLELGPLKVPDIRGRRGRFVPIIAPFLFMAFLVGFLPVWINTSNSGDLPETMSASNSTSSQSRVPLELIVPTLNRKCSILPRGSALSKTLEFELQRPNMLQVLEVRELDNRDCFRKWRMSIDDVISFQDQDGWRSIQCDFGTCIEEERYCIVNWSGERLVPREDRRKAIALLGGQVECGELLGRIFD